jgi:methionyl-tRNA synthetase
MEEDGYFFKLSAYQDWITDHITNQKEFIFPSSVRNEILSRLKGEKVHDLSISRPNQGWGIPVPGDEKHVIYTWFDALITYYTGSQIDERDQNRPSPWWPASVHVIGKDISWFHSVIWPSMLKSAGIELPGQIYVHGMVLGSDGKRMSKSLGNGVDPQECLKLFAVDSIRYYMLKNIPSGQDGAFSTEDLAKTHNSDLANELGNLLMRVLKLSQAQLGNEIKARQDVAFELTFLDEVKDLMDGREHSKALNLIWTGVRKLNAYINQEEPWKKKGDLEAFHAVMYTSLINLRFLCGLLIPFIPESATKALSFLGVDKVDQTPFDFKKEAIHLREGTALFPRILMDEEKK